MKLSKLYYSLDLIESKENACLKETLRSYSELILTKNLVNDKNSLSVLSSLNGVIGIPLLNYYPNPYTALSTKIISLRFTLLMILKSFR